METEELSRTQLGMRITHARRVADLTIVEAAKKIGISRVYLNNLERGQTGKRTPCEPPLRLLRRIAAALGTTASALVKE